MPTQALERLVLAVGRLRAPLYTKLMVAFVGSVLLLVGLGLLGLEVLRESNSRVEGLGALQQRATEYRQLETEAIQLRLLLGLRAGGSDGLIYAGESPTLNAPTSSELVSIDGSIANILSRLGTATDAAGLGFVPPHDEQKLLDQARLDYLQLSGVMERIIVLDKAGRSAEGLLLQSSDGEPLANDLILVTQRLASASQAQTEDLIAQNRGSFVDSQNLFIAVAAASVVLALLLGSLLSLSLIVPIRRMSRRLEAIASGDFSAHVNVDNHDELGALAANLNRMNDELGRLYGEIEMASRHKSEFLANMSHELRTPLNAIIGFSQVLRQQMFGDLNEKQIEYLDDILGSGQHLLTVINDILDLAKVESGRMELQPSIFSLHVTLENAVAIIRERATRQGIVLATDIDPSLGLVEADEHKLKQVLLNLLSNGVKFTPRGGRVTLSAHDGDDRVEISVRDTGVGISAADQSRIFEEFYQVGPDANHEGTGLGLAVTRRLVELHGGQIRVESVVGSGSNFIVTLPMHHPADAEAEAIAH